MAKKRTANKSQRVRDYLADHPDAGPTAVAKALGVSESLVSAIKAKTKAGRRGKRKAAKRSNHGRRGTAGKPSEVEPFVAAAELIRVCGGADEARAALATAARVASELQ